MEDFTWFYSFIQLEKEMEMKMYIIIISTLPPLARTHSLCRSAASPILG